MISEMPFITRLYDKKYEEQTDVVIQLKSKNYISYYDLNILKYMDRERFLRLCQQWWINANNMPISLYYKEVFEQFSYALKHLPTQDYEILAGYEGLNLKNITEKRIKRKVISI